MAELCTDNEWPQMGDSAETNRAFKVGETLRKDIPCFYVAKKSDMLCSRIHRSINFALAWSASQPKASGRADGASS